MKIIILALSLINDKEPSCGNMNGSGTINTHINSCLYLIRQQKRGQMDTIELSREAVREIISRDHQRVEELERECKELRQMRERIIKALDSIHKTDTNGSVRAYRYDDAIKEIRDAVFGEPQEFEYHMPWFRNTNDKLVGLTLRGGHR